MAVIGGGDVGGWTELARELARLGACCVQGRRTLVRVLSVENG